jgi:hypothetical protein
MVAVLALAGGACGGDDDAEVTDDAEATDDASATSDDADSGDDGSDSGTNEWCVLMDNAETPQQLDDLDITDPESVEDAFKSVVDLMEDAAGSAPDEIDEDVQILVDQFKEVYDQLEEVDFNFVDIDQSALENPEADAASARIDEFCGFDSSDDVDIDSGDTDDTLDLGEIGGDTAREQMVSVFTLMGMTDEQANCVVDNIDLEALDAANIDPTQYFDLFEECGFDITNPGG